MREFDGALAPLFWAVGEALRSSRESLNASDSFNGNHGDHMVEIFETAALAAQEMSTASLADAMQAAATRLAQQPDNGSAIVYAHGLEQMARQFRHYGVTVDDFLAYVRKALANDGDSGAQNGPRSGETLKALVGGLVGWNAVEIKGSADKPQTDNEPQPDESATESMSRSLDLGALFDLGVAYMQAKMRGGGRSQVLADAAVSASPLKQVPHRYQSGKLAIQALLDAINSGV